MDKRRGITVVDTKEPLCFCQNANSLTFQKLSNWSKVNYEGQLLLEVMLHILTEKRRIGVKKIVE